MNKSITALGVALLWAAPLLAQHAAHQPAEREPAPPAATQPIAADPEGPHGGSLRSVGELLLEVVVDPTGIRVFAYDKQGKPLDTQAARGAAVLRVEGDPKRYRYDLYPDTARDGAASSLAVAVDLRRIAGASVGVEVQLAGLPGAGREPVRTVAQVSVPMTDEQRAAAAIAAQKVCPVSGEALGSMGEPIAVTVGDQMVYVCCQGCVAPVRAEPAKYLAPARGATGSVPPGTEEVRADVFKVSAADEPYIAAQKTCPVMDEPLDGMGGPYKVHADGKAVYICCPGCAKKIAAEPQAYLKDMAARGVEPPVVR
ncbi:hypothetical protein [Botrimarina sp.]|uniref:hypothetical protein n=1 Tax=Botrimarina sp. TaxID=2795802 RepID=UPI0032F03774